MQDSIEMRFANRARGIFKPAGMRTVLSIRTSAPRKGRDARYEDQGSIKDIFTLGDQPLRYAFQGNDPDSHDNRLLREAYERQLPLIWFWAVAPARYRPIAPVFVTAWRPELLRVEISPTLAASEPRVTSDVAGRVGEGDSRRYAIQVAKRRLHQALFRARVVDAYGGRCAMSGLPSESLVDAAHIVEDGNEALGHPLVSNGLCLSKLHHAAFDRHLIGVDPVRQIHLAPRLLEEKDGPMLELLKALDGQRLAPPKNPDHSPNLDRLAFRFERFQAFSL
jgi:putative restriction endonuclease